MVEKNIVIIPGLNCDMKIWKITKTNHESVYEYLKKKHNLIELVLPIHLFKSGVDNLLLYMDKIIPKDSYLISNSFGSVPSLLYFKKYSNKVKAMMFIDPTTQIENYRFTRVFDLDIRNNLFEMQLITQNYKYLRCPIISHTILPFKKLMNPDKLITDQHAFEVLNTKFSYLQSLSNNPKSNIILHPNRSHFLHQYESEKIKLSIEYLVF